MSKLAKATLVSLFTIALFTALNFGQQTLEQSANAVNNDRMVPQFIVDPYWPQPLPNKWLLGRTIGIAVDERDHLYVVHRDQDEPRAIPQGRRSTPVRDVSAEQQCSKRRLSCPGGALHFAARRCVGVGSQGLRIAQWRGCGFAPLSRVKLV